MKINIQLLIVILITILIVLCNSCICQAISVDTGSFRPEIQEGKIIDSAEIILGAIVAVGGVLITVFIAITGFGIILGSAEEKAVAKEKFVGYIIAAVVLFGGAAIANFLINLFMS